MQEVKVYFSVIGYVPGKPKNIIYRKNYNECVNAQAHLTKVSQLKPSLFFVIRIEIEPVTLTLF